MSEAPATPKGAMLISAIVATSAVTAYCGWSLRDFALDDAFITYRYARNVADGHGLVFHPGQAVLGTSTPGYAFLLAGLHQLSGLSIPTLSKVLGCTVTALAGVLLATLLSPTVHWGAAVIAAAFLASNPILQLTAGMEAPLYVVLIVLLFVLCERRRPLAVGFVLGVAILVRLDALALTVLPIWTWLRAENRARTWLHVGGAAFAVVLPWTLYASYVYGSPIPSSLHAKQHLYDVLPQAEPHRLFVRGLFDIPYWLMQVNPALALLVPIVLVGAVQCVRRRASWSSALGIWMVAYLIAFEWADLPNLSIWYWAPFQVLFVVCMSLAIDAAFRFARGASSPSAWGATALLCAMAIGAQLATATMVGVPPRASAYRAIGESLKCHAVDDATIATWEIGIVGYYSQCRVLDFAGIVTPSSVGHTPDTLIEHHQPKWVVGHSHAGYELWRDFPTHESMLPPVAVYRLR